MLFPQLYDIINPCITLLQGNIMSKKLRPRIDYDSLVNTKINKWLIISYEFLKPRMRFNCICDCGTYSKVTAVAVMYGYSKQCKECNLKTNGMKRTHGYFGKATYRTWIGLRNRCNNPNGKDYIRYGGRGIKVDERWNKFENFLADMGEKPKGLSIDRINNDGNYEPGNCRWATASQQISNQRRPRRKRKGD